MAQPHRQPALSALGQRPHHRSRLGVQVAAGARGLELEHILEVGDHLGVVGVAVGLALRRRGLDHRRQRGRDLRPLDLDVGKLLADVLHRDRHLVLAGERNLAGQHLVQHDAERVEVRLAADVPSERLLGGDVVGRAEHTAVGRQSVLLERPRDPEVGHLGRALVVDQHVLWLDVAVNDVLGVRQAECARDLDRVRDRLGDRQAPVAADPLLERLALDVFEHDVGAGVGGIAVVTGVDHADDVRMRQTSDGSCLAPEPLQLVGIGRHLAVHQLDRDLALERLVERPVHRRHAARGDPRFESVAAAEAGSEDRAHRAGRGWTRATTATLILRYPASPPTRFAAHRFTVA